MAASSDTGNLEGVSDLENQSKAAANGNIKRCLCSSVTVIPL
jgi:hypothetical protein